MFNVFKFIKELKEKERLVKENKTGIIKEESKEQESISDKKDLQNKNINNNGHSVFVEYQKLRENISNIANSLSWTVSKLATLLVISVILNFYLGYKAVNPVREYFAGENGRYLPIQPLSRPFVNDKRVVQFSAEGLRTAFTLDFLNYRTNLSNAKDFFTKNGFNGFIDQLKKSQYFKILKEEKGVITVTTGTGVVVKSGYIEEKGRYEWIIQMPIEIRAETYTQNHLPQKFIVVLKVVRVSTLENVDGIGIESMIMKSE